MNSRKITAATLAALSIVLAACAPSVETVQTTLTKVQAETESAVSSSVEAAPVVTDAQKPMGVYSPNAYYEYLVGSAVWQLSAESQALMQQAYETAKGEIQRMSEMCKDEAESNWSFDSDGFMTCGGKRVAVISDIDDTLVDGVHYTANIVGKDGDMNNAAFARFVMSNGCTALPGAVDFVNYCKDSGVEFYYITNRYDQGYKIGQSDSQGGYPEAGGGQYLAADGSEIGTTTYQVFGKSFYDITLESMEKLGFPIDDKHLIMNDSKLNGASKENARNAISDGTASYPNGQRSDGNSTGSALSISCEPHYVAMLLGDQLTDFTDDFSSPDLDAVSRGALTSEYSENWGSKWILLPNAVYGSAFESASSYGIDKLLDNYDYTK